MAQEGYVGELFPVVAITPVEFEEPRFALREKRDSLRKEKIARIREQILQGTYQISAAEVAKSILQNGTSQLRRKKKAE